MVEIREAVTTDCRGIAEVQVDSYRTSYVNFFPKSYLDQFSYDEQEQDWLNLLNANAGDILLVAVSADQQIIGYTLARTGVDIYAGYDAEIVALHVRLAFQGQGIGTALLQGAVTKLKERGCKSVMLWTLKGNPVRKWYEGLQGKLIGEKRDWVDGQGIVEVAYGWDSMKFDFMEENHGQPA